MKRLLSIIIVILSLPCSCLISETVTYTLENAIEKALKNNNEIGKFEAGIKIAQAQFDQSAGDFWLPGINVNAGINLIDPGSVEGSVINAFNVVSNASVGPVSLPVLQSNEVTNVFFDNYSVGLGITKTLFSGFRLWNSMELRKINLDMSKEMLHDKKKEISALIRTLFYSYLYIARNLDMYQEINSHFKTRFDEIMSRYAGGYISEFDKLTAEVQYKSTIPSLYKLSNALYAAKNAICEQIGEADPSNIEFLGNFYSATNSLDENISYNDALAKAESNNITLKTVDYSLEMSKISRNIAEGMRWPVLTGFFNYDYDLKKEHYLDSDRKWLTGWNTGVELVMPIDSLLPVSKTAGMIREEEGNFERLEWVKKETADSIDYRIRNLMDSITYGREIRTSQLEILESALTGYSMALERYKKWASPVAEVNGMEMTYYLADIDYIGSILDMYTNTVTLHRMID